MAKFLLLFSTGSFGYSVIELLWRGRTHWSMFLLGGVCFCTLFYTFNRMEASPIILKALTGGIIITSLELTTGFIVNILLKWNVWSYASVPYNFLGQICLPYTILWMLLSIPICYLCRLLSQYI